MGEIPEVVKMPCLGMEMAVVLCIKVVKTYQHIPPKCKHHIVCQLYWNKFDFKIKSEKETETYSLYGLQRHYFLHPIVAVTTALHAHGFPVICSWAVESALSLGLISTPWRNKTGAWLSIYSNPNGGIGWCATHLDGEWKESRKTQLTPNTDYSSWL